VPHNINVARHDDKQTEELAVQKGDMIDEAKSAEHDLEGKK